MKKGENSEYDTYNPSHFGAILRQSGVCYGLCYLSSPCIPASCYGILADSGYLEGSPMKASHIKGLIHAAMSALAIVEAAESKHAARRALNGLSAVYHALCVVYHLKYEIDENQDLTRRVPRARIQAL